MAEQTARLKLEGFLGLYQGGDGVLEDPRYAVEAVNVETRGGVLAAAARARRLEAEMEEPIGTLARLHRRWHAEEGERDVLVAASGGALYWMLPDGEAWTKLGYPEGTEAYRTDAWSWVTYEMNPEGSDAPVDVLLLSNAQDGMVCVRGDDMSVTRVETPRKFGVIARYAERIWGGAIEDDPDMLVYSAPFDPFDWSANVEIPEDGAGDILQPSWDGDSFTALMPFGSQLIALKRERVWRILGTDPGEYAFKEQYGGGAAFAGTVAVEGERMLMLGREGLLQYDGLSVAPYAPQYARGVFARMNREALEQARGCVYGGRYYCALPLDGAESNSAVLVYDAREQTWLVREGVSVKAFLPTGEGLFFTSATEPGRVYRWGEDAFTQGAATPCRWVGPWLELSRKDARKGGWTVYLWPQAREATKLYITIRTEKRARTKICEVEAGDTGRQKRLTFGGSGRRFRVEIESRDGQAWALSGGMQVLAELDPD